MHHWCSLWKWKRRPRFMDINNFNFKALFMSKKWFHNVFSLYFSEFYYINFENDGSRIWYLKNRPLNGHKASLNTNWKWIFVGDVDYRPHPRPHHHCIRHHDHDEDHNNLVDQSLSFSLRHSSSHLYKYYHDHDHWYLMFML